jgi:acetyl esterase
MADRPSWLVRLLGDDAPPNPTSVDDVHVLRKLADGDPDAPPPSNDGVAEWHRAVTIREGQNPLAAEVVVPSGRGPHPVVVWLHGGAWCIGNAAGARRVVSDIAGSGCVVVNLDYSLAPEHPFPQAVVDVLDAWAWLATGIVDFGGDLNRVALGGTSAGANLVAAATVAASGDGVGRIVVPDPLPAARALVLLYGVFDFPLLNNDTRSNSGYVEHLYNAAYLGSNFLSMQADPLVSPARSSHLATFPPTLVSCGAQDDLLAQSLAMIDALARAGVEVRGSIASGLDHSFDVFDDDASRQEIRATLDWLREVLA